jgi:ferric-dicitrate binding protein FerR (iron transport regulator)
MAGTVEQLNTVRDAAHDALGGLAERLIDTEVVQHLPPVRRAKRRRMRRRMFVMLLLGVAIGAGIACYLRWREEEEFPDVAPDAFGAGIGATRVETGDPMVIGSRSTPDN